LAYKTFVPFLATLYMQIVAVDHHLHESDFFVCRLLALPPC